MKAQNVMLHYEGTKRDVALWRHKT